MVQTNTFAHRIESNCDLGLVFIFQVSVENKYSTVGKHLKDEHQAKIPDLDKYFSTLRKCQGKLDC